MIEVSISKKEFKKNGGFHDEYTGEYWTYEYTISELRKKKLKKIDKRINQERHNKL